MDDRHSSPHERVLAYLREGTSSFLRPGAEKTRVRRCTGHFPTSRTARAQMIPKPTAPTTPPTTHRLPGTSPGREPTETDRRCTGERTPPLPPELLSDRASERDRLMAHCSPRTSVAATTGPRLHALRPCTGVAARHRAVRRGTGIGGRRTERAQQPHGGGCCANQSITRTSWTTAGFMSGTAPSRTAPPLAIS